MIWVLKQWFPVIKPMARDPIYRGRVFDAEIIELCVRWYITFRLSYRDLVAMMAERGLHVSHTTILRWVIRYDRISVCMVGNTADACVLFA
jgi:transposase-like protein